MSIDAAATPSCRQHRRASSNRKLGLARNGVRFGVYKDDVYHDRLFPYDHITIAHGRDYRDACSILAFS